MKLKDKVAWVVGASSGIGKELVKVLHEEGAKLVLSSRREDELNKVCKELSIQDNDYLILPFDLSDFSNEKELVNRVKDKFGRIDVLINNSGINQRSIAVKTADKVERKIMEVNYFGHIKIAKAVINEMIKQKEGKVVVINSIVGKFGLPRLSSYSASKHALKGYFESLRYEVEKYGVKILLIYPGFIATDIVNKSLTEDGSEFSKQSSAQEKGMSPYQCAQKIICAIKGNKLSYNVGGKETLISNLKYFAPRMFHRLMARLHQF